MSRRRGSGAAAEAAAVNPQACVEAARDPYGVAAGPCSLQEHLGGRRNCASNPLCVYGLGELRRGIWAHKHEQAAATIGKSFPGPLARLGPNPAGSIRDPLSTPMGLINLGATCYLNALIQVLYLNAQFREAVFSIDAGAAGLSPSEAEDVRALQRVFTHMCMSTRASHAPREFVRRFELDAHVQQDAQEFNKVLLAHFECIFAKLAPSAPLDGPPPLAHVHTLTHAHTPGHARPHHGARADVPRERVIAPAKLIPELFSGSYAYVTECAQCHTRRGSSMPFYELSVSIQGASCVEDGVTAMFAEEKLTGANQYACETCAKKCNASRRMELRSLPPVLNLQLLRFVFDIESSGKRKLKDSVQIPDILDLRNLAACQGSPLVPDEPAVYELTAVLYHKGDSAHHGHYVADAWDDVRCRWWTFDDDSVLPTGTAGDGDKPVLSVPAAVQRAATVAAQSAESIAVSFLQTCRVSTECSAVADAVAAARAAGAAPRPDASQPCGALQRRDSASLLSAPSPDTPEPNMPLARQNASCSPNFDAGDDAAQLRGSSLPLDGRGDHTAYTTTSSVNRAPADASAAVKAEPLQPEQEIDGHTAGSKRSRPRKRNPAPSKPAAERSVTSNRIRDVKGPFKPPRAGQVASIDATSTSAAAGGVPEVVSAFASQSSASTLEPSLSGSFDGNVVASTGTVEGTAPAPTEPPVADSAAVASAAAAPALAAPLATEMLDMSTGSQSDVLALTVPSRVSSFGLAELDTVTLPMPSPDVVGKAGAKMKRGRATQVANGHRMDDNGTVLPDDGSTVRKRARPGTTKADFDVWTTEGSKPSATADSRPSRRPAARVKFSTSDSDGAASTVAFAASSAPSTAGPARQTREKAAQRTANMGALAMPTTEGGSELVVPVAPAMPDEHIAGSPPMFAATGRANVNSLLSSDQATTAASVSALACARGQPSAAPDSQELGSSAVPPTNMDGEFVSVDTYPTVRVSAGTTALDTSHDEDAPAPQAVSAANPLPLSSMPQTVPVVVSSVRKAEPSDAILVDGSDSSVVVTGAAPAAASTAPSRSLRKRASREASAPEATVAVESVDKVATAAASSRVARKRAKSAKGETSVERPAEVVAGSIDAQSPMPAATNDADNVTSTKAGKRRRSSAAASTQSPSLDTPKAGKRLVPVAYRCTKSRSDAATAVNAVAPEQASWFATRRHPAYANGTGSRNAYMLVYRRVSAERLAAWNEWQQLQQRDPERKQVHAAVAQARPPPGDRITVVLRTLPPPDASAVQAAAAVAPPDVGADNDVLKEEIKQWAVQYAIADALVMRRKALVYSALLDGMLASPLANLPSQLRAFTALKSLKSVADLTEALARSPKDPSTPSESALTSLVAGDMDEDCVLVPSDFLRNWVCGTDVIAEDQAAAATKAAIRRAATGAHHSVDAERPSNEGEALDVVDLAGADSAPTAPEDLTGDEPNVTAPTAARATGAALHADGVSLDADVLPWSDVCRTESVLTQLDDAAARSVAPGSIDRPWKVISGRTLRIIVTDALPANVDVDAVIHGVQSLEVAAATSTTTSSCASKAKPDASETSAPAPTGASKVTSAETTAPAVVAGDAALAAAQPEPSTQVADVDLSQRPEDKAENTQLAATRRPAAKTSANGDSDSKRDRKRASTPASVNTSPAPSKPARAASIRVMSPQQLGLYRIAITSVCAARPVNVVPLVRFDQARDFVRESQWLDSLLRAFRRAEHAHVILTQLAQGDALDGLERSPREPAAYWVSKAWAHAVKQTAQAARAPFLAQSDVVAALQRLKAKASEAVESSRQAVGPNDAVDNGVAEVRSKHDHLANDGVRCLHGFLSGAANQRRRLPTALVEKLLEFADDGALTLDALAIASGPQAVEPCTQCAVHQQATRDMEQFERSKRSQEQGGALRTLHSPLRAGLGYPKGDIEHDTVRCGYISDGAYVLCAAEWMTAWRLYLQYTSNPRPTSALPAVLDSASTACGNPTCMKTHPSLPLLAFLSKVAQLEAGLPPDACSIGMQAPEPWASALPVWHRLCTSAAFHAIGQSLSKPPPSCRTHCGVPEPAIELLTVPEFKALHNSYRFPSVEETALTKVVELLSTLNAQARAGARVRRAQTVSGDGSAVRVAQSTGAAATEPTILMDGSAARPAAAAVLEAPRQDAPQDSLQHLGLGIPAAHATSDAFPDAIVVDDKPDTVEILLQALHSETFRTTPSVLVLPLASARELFTLLTARGLLDASCLRGELFGAGDSSWLMWPPVCLEGVAKGLAAEGRARSLFDHAMVNFVQLSHVSPTPGAATSAAALVHSTSNAGQGRSRATRRNAKADTTYAIALSSSERVEQVRLRLMQSADLDSMPGRLYFDGKPLPESVTLEQAGVWAGDVLHFRTVLGEANLDELAHTDGGGGGGGGRERGFAGSRLVGSAPPRSTSESAAPARADSSVQDVDAPAPVPVHTHTSSAPAVDGSVELVEQDGGRQTLAVSTAIDVMEVE